MVILSSQGAPPSLLWPMQVFTWETREQRKPLKREASWRGGRHWWGERRGDSWERGEEEEEEGAKTERDELVFNFSLCRSLTSWFLLWCLSCKQSSWLVCRIRTLFLFYFFYFINTYLFKRQVIYLISILTINLDQKDKLISSYKTWSSSNYRKQALMRNCRHLVDS